MVSPHALYCLLVGEADWRLVAYRELFRSDLEPGVVDQLRALANGKTVLGDEHFSARVAEALGCLVASGGGCEVSPRPRRFFHCIDRLWWVSRGCSQ